MYSICVVIMIEILIVMPSIAQANVSKMVIESKDNFGISNNYSPINGQGAINFKNDSLSRESSTEVSEEKDVSMAEYNKNVADLTKISIKDVESLFTEEKDAILYIGRPTCYYCRQFSPEIMRFNQMMGNSVVYYDTDGNDFDKEAEDIIFNKIGIPGTPTTLYIKKGEIVSAWVGGGISAEYLHDFLLVENIKIASNYLFVVKKGTTIQMHADSSPEKNISPLEWSSNNEAIVKINDKGQLTALSEGITKINVKTIDGKSDSVIVRITK